MAKQVVERMEGEELNTKQLLSFYSNHIKYIHEDDWASMPELTNHDGNRCHFSCFAQAWSVATILESLTKD